MLKILATLAYNVLGGRTAFILKGRVLLQQSYLPRPDTGKNYNMDDQFVEPLLSKWQDFVAEIPLLQGFQLPRHLPCVTPFCVVCMLDEVTCALQLAPGWFGKMHKRNSYLSRLIICWGKVRALKDTNSITKAELEALNLSREIILTIQAAWKCPFNVFRVFVDSMLVYHWCRMSASRLGVFHMNSVEKILRTET